MRRPVLIGLTAAAVVAGSTSVLVLASIAFVGPLLVPGSD